MERTERDPEPGVPGAAVSATPAGEDGLRILLGRAHHELATPLLTAAGFSRIAVDLVGGSGAGRGSTPEELAPALARVSDGLGRARAVLAAVAALAEDPGFARLDLVDVLRRAADDLVGSGTPVELARLPSTIRCHGVPSSLHELVRLLLELFTRDRGGTTGDPATIDVAASGAPHVSSVVVTLAAPGEPWPPSALAATERPPSSGGHRPTTVVPASAASLASRAATLGRAQLGRLWLDPAPDVGRRVATLRLLAGDRSAPDDEDDS